MATPTTDRPPPPGPAPSAGVIPAEWPAQAADTIVETIDKVRDKTTRPALVAARAVVYGLLGAVIGSMALLLVLIGGIRALDNYLPGDVWAIYAGFFAVFTLAGIWALRRANRPAPARS